MLARFWIEPSRRSASVENILDRFEDAWNGPTPLRIEDYLRAGEPPQRRALLVELVRIDLERRLSKGECVRLDETSLPRFPELKADRASLVSLTAHEYELRRRREPNLSPNEYLERWPQYRDDLIRLLTSNPTLTTNDETRDGKPPVESPQDSEETREVFAFFLCMLGYYVAWELRRCSRKPCVCSSCSQKARAAILPKSLPHKEIASIAYA